MSWETQRRRRGGRGRAAAEVGAESNKALAEEIKQAIFSVLPRAAQTNGAARRQEWTCGCSTTNWIDRPRCRHCQAPRPPPLRPEAKAPGRVNDMGRGRRGAPGGPQPSAGAPRLPASSVWADGPTSRAQATALGGVAAAAQAAGASPETVEALTREAAGARTAAAGGRQLGARLDSHRAAVRRLTAQEAAAEKAVADASARLLKVQQELEDAREALADVEAEVLQERSTEPEGAADQPITLELGTRQLLQALEGAPLAGVPESVLAAMKALHECLDDVPTDEGPPPLEEALPDARPYQTTSAARGSGESQGPTGTGATDADANMVDPELKRASEELPDDAEFGALIRAKIHRSTPY